MRAVGLAIDFSSDTLVRPDSLKGLVVHPSPLVLVLCSDGRLGFFQIYDSEAAYDPKQKVDEVRTGFPFMRAPLSPSELPRFLSPELSYPERVQ